MVNKKDLKEELKEEIKFMEQKLKETEELMAKIKVTGSHHQIKELIDEFSGKKPKQDFISLRDLGDENDSTVEALEEIKEQESEEGETGHPTLDWIKKVETNAELLNKGEQVDTGE